MQRQSISGGFGRIDHRQRRVVMLHAVRRPGLRLAHFPRPLHVAGGRPCRYQPVIAGAVSVQRPFVGRGLKEDLDDVVQVDLDAFFQRDGTVLQLEFIVPRAARFVIPTAQERVFSRVLA